jgi:hypothetical protein
MPELLIDFITSLDGYAAADGWPGWWGLEGPESMRAIGSRTFDGRIQLLEYVPTILAGPPGAGSVG